MIDYEITIDVRGFGFSEEKKKRVQEAFFKLGFAWQDGGRLFKHTYKDFYTNIDDLEEVTGFLMWGSHLDCNQTHTYEQLMELAGMSDKKEFTVDDLKDGHIVTNEANQSGIVFRDKIYSESFNAYLIDYDNLSVFMGSNSSDCAIIKVETLEGEVLYERDKSIKLNDGQTLSVKELKRMADGNYSDIIPKMAKYILDKEGLS